MSTVSNETITVNLTDNSVDNFTDNTATPVISEARQRYLDTVAHDFISVKLSCNKLGNAKTEKGEIKERFVTEIEAESNLISIRKTLIDPKCPELQACLALERSVVEYWKSISMPTPEPGYRIMRQNKYREFCDYVAQQNQALKELAEKLEIEMPLIKERSKAQLGQGFQEDDYPVTVADKFYFQLFTHILEIPDTLEEELRQHEKQKVDAILELTVGAAEQAFVIGMQKVVTELLERLAPGPDGKTNRLTDATITHILDFIEKFRVLNFRSNPDLEKIMDDAEEILGLDLDMADAIRRDKGFKNEIKSKFDTISERLSSLVVGVPEQYSVYEPVGGSFEE